MDDLEDFFRSHIKVANRTGNLGNDIKVGRDESGNCINVTVVIPFSKRYLKYLTKKWLKSKQLRDHIRVTAPTKNAYFLKFYPQLQGDADAAEEEE